MRTKAEISKAKCERKLGRKFDHQQRAKCARCDNPATEMWGNAPVCSLHAKRRGGNGVKAK